MIFFDIDNTLIDHHKSDAKAIILLCNYLGVDCTDVEKIITTWSNISKEAYNQYLSGKISFREQRIHKIRLFLSRFGATPITKQAQPLE